MIRASDAINLEFDLALPGLVAGSVAVSPRKRLGRVFTPVPIARALAQWAIRSEHDRVLDLGVGEGVFFGRTIATGA